MAAWRYEISPLVLKKYFTRSLRSLVKYFSKRNFVSPRGHVISSIYHLRMIIYISGNRNLEEKKGNCKRCVKLGSFMSQWCNNV